jgi:hypothetical protein
VSRLRILYSRLRAEEKQLAAAAEAKGIPCSLEDIRTAPWRIEPHEGDVSWPAASATCRTPRSRDCLKPAVPGW